MSSSLDTDLPPRLRATMLEALVIGARADYQVGFTPRATDSVVGATLEEVDEEGEPALAPGLDLSDAQDSTDGTTWLVTFYPQAPGGRGTYWIECTFTTALGLIHKRFVRLKVV